MAEARKYAGVIVLDAEGQPKRYAKGMPMFVLLGQDEFAPAAIEAYAELLDRAGMVEQAEAARAFALNARAWQLENPALVHRPD